MFVVFLIFEMNFVLLNNRNLLRKQHNKNFVSKILGIRSLIHSRKPNNSNKLHT